MTLTASQVQAFGAGAGLDTDAIDILISAAYAAIDQRLATSDPMRERFTVRGPLIVLSETASDVTDVTENGTTLDPDDYELRGALLLRLSSGPSPSQRWRGVVDVTYTGSQSDGDLRDAIALQIVKLDLNIQHGLTQRTIGNYSESFEGGTAGYQTQRDAILSQLRQPTYLL